MKDSNVNHAVRYDHFGHVDVLYIAELPKPEPKAGQVIVKMKAAGINPGEASIREGMLKDKYPSTFPSGQGSDFAGVIDSVGDGVSRFKAGEEVIGFSHERSSHAEYVAVPTEQVVMRPAKVSWEQGGGLFIAGTTAYAAVRAVNLKEGDVVVVSGAAGGVGSLVVQLAKNKGAKVIGLASESHHQWLNDHGIQPLAYGEHMQQEIQKLKPNAFIDCYGKGYVEMAINMGIPADRIDTIIDFEAAQKYQVKTDGSAKAANAEVLKELADMVADGKLEVPIAKTYPLNQIKEAFEELEKRHSQGKIVLTSSAN